VGERLEASLLWGAIVDAARNHIPPTVDVGE